MWCGHQDYSGWVYWPLFLENAFILMIWGCFSIISNVIWSNYCCRRHTMHGNMVFLGILFSLPHNKADVYVCAALIGISNKRPVGLIAPPFITRLLGRPQPQMYPPVALNQNTLVNRTHKHFINIYMLQGPTNFLKSHQSSTICKIWK